MDVSPRSRMTRQRWVRKGLQRADLHGLAALGIAALAADLGVTKGSFYWHFEGRSALFEALVQCWQNDQLQSLQRCVTSGDAAKVRLMSIANAATGDSLELLFSAASKESDVASRVTAVTERRLALIVHALSELSCDEPHERALQASASLVGYQQQLRLQRAATATPQATLDPHADDTEERSAAAFAAATVAKQQVEGRRAAFVKAWLKTALR